MIEQVRSLPVGLRAAYVLLVGVLATLVWLAPTLARRAALMVRFPLVDGWFPDPLQAVGLYAGVVVLQFAVMVLALARPSRTTLRLFAWTTLGFGAVLLVHQASFGAASSVLFFWTGVWALWLTHATRGFERGPFFCLLLLGGMFAWPALGKLTPGYLSGEVYWRAHWNGPAGPQGIHMWVARVLSEPAHERLLRWFGPLSVAVEGAVALAWLLPGRWGFGVVGLGAVGILAMAGPSFIRVMGIVAAVAASGWVLAASEEVRAANAENAARS